MQREGAAGLEPLIDTPYDPNCCRGPQPARQARETRPQIDLGHRVATRRGLLCSSISPSKRSQLHPPTTCMQLDGDFIATVLESAFQGVICKGFRKLCGAMSRVGGEKSPFASTDRAYRSAGDRLRYRRHERQAGPVILTCQSATEPREHPRCRGVDHALPHISFTWLVRA